MNMFFSKKKESVLSREPYATFIKKFEKLSGVTNEKIHIRIASNMKKENAEQNNGFTLDSVYTKRFDLDFQYLAIVDDVKMQNQRFCIFHTISYKFEDEDYQDLMMDTISDFKKKNGYFYMSSDVKECEIDCHINGKGVVAVDFFVVCEKDKALEVSLQLISQDIALFCRSF